PRGVQSPKELVRMFRRFDRRNAGCVEESVDNEQEPSRDTGASGRSRDDDGASAQSADDFCSRELAERRLKGWYIRKTDHGGDWRGPYSTIASVSLMIARELGKELARRDALAGCD